jgi:hypothetical protein
VDGQDRRSSRDCKSDLDSAGSDGLEDMIAVVNQGSARRSYSRESELAASGGDLDSLRRASPENVDAGERGEFVIRYRSGLG